MTALIEKRVTDVIRSDRTLFERECFMLFCPMVASKSAAIAAKSLHAFCQLVGALDKDGIGPITRALEIMNDQGEERLEELLRESRCGKYAMMMGFFRSYVEIRPDLVNGRIEDFERLHGVSYKSSRFYAQMNRPEIRVAALDTHILAELRENRCKKVPRQTPTSWKQYERLQRAWLRHCKLRHPDKTPQQVDIETWVRRSGSAFKLPELFA